MFHSLSNVPILGTYFQNTTEQKLNKNFCCSLYSVRGRTNAWIYTIFDELNCLSDWQQNFELHKIQHFHNLQIVNHRNFFIWQASKWHKDQKIFFNKSANVYQNSVKK